MKRLTILATALLIGFGALPLAEAAKPAKAPEAVDIFEAMNAGDIEVKLIVNLIPERHNPVADLYLQQLNSFFKYATNQEEIDAASLCQLVSVDQN